MKLIDLTGLRYGRLLVIRQVPNVSSQKTAWLVRCDCGQEKTVRSGELRSGKTVSCGCKGAISHGHTANRRTSTEYRIWQGMIRRCTNPGYEHWDRYGGRGIAVRERWRRFEAFLADMGRRPKGLTLERIDNDGNYEPGNCRWATRKEQVDNRATSCRIDVNGATVLFSDLMRTTSIRRATVYARIFQMGWPVEKALTEPVRRLTRRCY